MWDILPNGRTAGGAPANVAYYATCLGANGIIVSSVGADRLGSDLLKHLTNMNLSTKYVTIDEKHPTGTAYASVDRQGNAKYTIPADVAWDYILRTPDISTLPLTSAIICFGTLAQRHQVSRDTIRWFVKAEATQACLNRSTRTPLSVFDVNLRPPYYSPDTIQHSFQMANVVKLNEEELKTVSRMLHLSGTAMDRLRTLSGKYDLQLIALTRGERGSVLYSYGKVSQHPGILTNIADTVGAGDAFVAALGLGILNKLQLDVINDYANRVAAYVCSQTGATPPIPEKLNISEYLAHQS